MATKIDTFKKLHTGSEAFILPNAWDAQSAAILGQTNFPAIGTSSAAVAASLGYEDGERMPFSDYLFIIKRIVASVAVPVTVDLEMGYGKTPEAIYSNIQQLISIGVAGINLEDSIIVNETRSLKNANEFARTMELITSRLAKDNTALFLNVRCDTYLLKVNDTEQETAFRMSLYESAGADGIFLPFIKDEQAIKNAVANTRLPVNVMAVPGIPDVQKLTQLGVKRISMGPFLNIKTYSTMKALAKSVYDQQSLNSIL